MLIDKPSKFTVTAEGSLNRSLPVNPDAIDVALRAAFNAAPIRRKGYVVPESTVKTEERMYAVGEAIFGLFGERMVSRGWSIFPQERDSNRRPGKLDGRTLAWKPYQDERPSAAEVQSWAAQCPTHNVAIITGKASSYAFAVDIDVGDLARSQDVERIARETLGTTPFRRIGRHPRIILVYRHEPEFDLRKSQMLFRDSTGAQTGDAVEILAGGSPFTAYGKHHSVGKYFNWQDYEPVSRGPSSLPLVTEAQVEEFRRRIGVKYGASVPSKVVVAGAKTAVGVARREGGVVIPARLDDKLVSDGRETVVRDVCFSWARLNPGASVEALLPRAVADCASRIVMDDKWTREIESAVRERLTSAVRTLSQGDRRPAVAWQGEGDTVYVPQAAVLEASDDEDMRLLCRQEKRSKLRFAKTEANATAAFERMLVKDEATRQKNFASVKGGVEGAIQRFLDDLWDAVLLGDASASESLDKISLLVAPTGSGKTTAFVRLFAAQERRRGKLGGPVALHTPSYANINEIRGRDDLGLGSVEPEESLEDIEAAADATGIRHMVYRGRLQPGMCAMADFVKHLQEVCVSASGLCEGKRTSGEPGDEPERCQHYATCPAMAQRRMVKNMDLIFLPTAFLDTQLPSELKRAVKAVVIDERSWNNMVHKTKFPMLEALLSNRIAPYSTDREKKRAAKDGKPLMDPDFLLQDRRNLNRILIDAARDGRDMALAVLDHKDGTVTGEEMLANAITVDARTSRARQKIRPNMAAIELHAAISEATDAHLWSEKRLYTCIAERIEWLKKDRENAAMESATGVRAPRLACGDKDRRIARLTYGEPDRVGDIKWVDRSDLVVSWRTKPNFGGLPTLMLDASADPDIISKLWLGRKVDTIKVPAPLHMRILAVIDSVYSNRSMSPRCHDVGMGAVNAAKRQVKIKDIICTTSVLYPKVLVGTAQAIKTEFNTSWAHPVNVDWLHYGATRGLDFAKHHKCCIAIGRMEMRVEDLDATVAALTYDDETPEPMIDANGSGKDSSGNSIRCPMVERRIKKRDGSDIIIQAPAWQGKWAGKVQRQSREEELRQYVGRIRPVYAEGKAPLVILLTTVIPEDFVIDDAVTLDDMTSNVAFDAIRRAGGFLDAHLTPALAPDLESKEAVRALIAEIDAAGALKDSRIGQGFARVSYQIDDEVHENKLVSLSVGDMATAIARAHRHRKFDLSLDTDIDLRILEVGSDAPRIEGSRAPDTRLIEAVGTLEQRAHDELKLTHDIMLDAFRRGTQKRGAKLVKAGTGDLEKVWLTVPEFGVLRLAGKA